MTTKKREELIAWYDESDRYPLETWTVQRERIINDLKSLSCSIEAAKINYPFSRSSIKKLESCYNKLINIKSSINSIELIPRPKALKKRGIKKGTVRSKNTMLLASLNVGDCALVDISQKHVWSKIHRMKQSGVIPMHFSFTTLDNRKNTRYNRTETIVKRTA